MNLEGNYDHEKIPEFQARIISANPLLKPEHFKSVADGSDAILMVTYATGTVGQRLMGVIRNTVDSGTPVFLLSNNPADMGNERGIKNDQKYSAQVPISEAGAIALQTVNINDINEVFDIIRVTGQEGLRGKELGEAIRQKFSIKKKE